MFWAELTYESHGESQNLSLVSIFLQRLHTFAQVLDMLSVTTLVPTRNSIHSIQCFVKSITKWAEPTCESHGESQNLSLVSLFLQTPAVDDWFTPDLLQGQGSTNGAIAKSFQNLCVSVSANFAIFFCNTLQGWVGAAWIHLIRKFLKLRNNWL